jgi:hypothetical protein
LNYTLFIQYAASSLFKHQADTLIMKNTLLITCPRCDYRINGRLWRCPGCGGYDDNNPRQEKIKKSQQEFWSRIIAALNMPIEIC